jgi:PAS domain S-box-containing protein
MPIDSIVKENLEALPQSTFPEELQPAAQEAQEMQQLRAELGALREMLDGYEESALRQSDKLAEMMERQREQQRALETELSARKQAEELLRQSQERFEQIAEQATEMIWEVDANGLYTYVSRVCEKLTGYCAAELIGKKHFYDLHPANEREAFRQGALAAFQGREIFHDLLNPIETKDGRIVWVSTNGIPLVDAHGSLVGYRGSDTDVTERKAAQAALEQASLIVERSQVMLLRWKVDAKWPLDYVSHNISRLGYDAQDLLAGRLSFSNIVYTEDRRRIGDETVAKLDEGVDAFTQEYRLVTADGEIRWIQDHSTVERDSAGHATRIQGILIDITESKAAEEALRCANLIVENSPVLLFRWKIEPGCPVDYVSENVSRLGWNHQDLISNRINSEEMVHPDDRAKANADAARHIDAGEASFTQEYRLLTPKGEVRWVQDDSTVIRDETGRMIYVQGILTDITERREAEEALRKANLIVENSQAILFLWRNDDGWPVEYVSENIRQLGYDPKDLTSGHIHWSKLMHPDDIDRINEEAGYHMDAGHNTYVQEYRILAADGSAHWVQDDCKILRDADGNTTHIQSILTDISERKAAELALQESEEKFRTLFAASPVGIALWSRDGKLLYNNPAMQNIFGAPAEQSSQFVLLNIPTLPDFVRERLARRESVSYEERLDFDDPALHNCMKTSRSGVAHLSMSFIPLGPEVGATLQGCTLCQAVDITKRKTAELAAEVRNRELQAFVYTVSHDLRSPLVTMGGFAELLDNEYADRLDDVGKSYLRRVRSSVENMGKLLSALVEISRVGRIEETQEDVDIGEVLGEVVQAYDDSLQKVSAHVQIADDPPTVHYTRVRLSQIFANLISNAIKFSRDGVPLEIAVGWKQEGRYYHFFVKDNGIGIAPNHQAKVFQIFSRLRQKNVEGTGVGLAIVQRIIEQNDGRIWVESVPGTGSTFWFTIPMH